MSCDLGCHIDWLVSHSHGNVMEIGVREGHSTAAILRGFTVNGKRYNHLWSVDKEKCAHHFDLNWTFIQGNSVTEAERILDATGMRSNDLWLELLFIDGDHTYNGCLSDLTNFGKYAKVIAVHDTNSEWLGVWQATIEYFRSPWAGSFQRAEFLNASHGLGVLYR